MLKRLHILFIALLGITFAGCSTDDDVWDNVPTKIAEFINQYYPNSQLSTCEKTGSDWHVRIKDGVGITFNSQFAWTNIAGYGETMPQVLLFDQLPPALYSYLEEVQALDGVYGLERDSKQYVVALSNTSVTYDIDTESVHSQQPPM
ncbi:MAG: PepSY-like domain-containing protein [Muribaculaceae bacterium]|nr:PepSY-like domain-containing protein [Muribaculaceae bacterium]